MLDKYTKTGFININTSLNSYISDTKYIWMVNREEFGFIFAESADILAHDAVTPKSSFHNRRIRLSAFPEVPRTINCIAMTVTDDTNNKNCALLGDTGVDSANPLCPVSQS